MAPPGCYEVRQFPELGHSDGRLHVSQLQVVADVRVSVFVIVSERQIAQLPVKALAAGVVLARIAPADRGPSRGTTPPASLAEAGS